MIKAKNEEIFQGYLGNDLEIFRLVGDKGIEHNEMGKTLLLHEIVSGELAQETAVFVIENDKSFVHICQLLNGEILSLKENAIPAVINQFVNAKKMFAVFEIGDAVLEQGIVGKLVGYIVKRIIMQFMSGERIGQFLIVVSDGLMMSDLAKSEEFYFRHIDNLLRKYGGSLITCFEANSSFANEYEQYFQRIK